MHKTAMLACVVGAAIAAGPPADAAPEPTTYPRYLPAPGGEAILPTPRAEEMHAKMGYAAARRVGDVIYLSGVIAAPRPGEGRDRAAFEDQLRRAFRTLEATLAAAGASFADVANINSFHVWEGPGFSGDRQSQIEAFVAVKREFMPQPHPAWTAVGVTGFLRPESVVEIQMTAHRPTTAPAASSAETPD